MEANPAPCTPEEDGEEDEGRRVLSEVLEEDALLTPCAFQTARFMRFSNRRPHHQETRRGIRRRAARPLLLALAHVNA
jgi:hypothetical protein